MGFGFPASATETQPRTSAAPRRTGFLIDRLPTDLFYTRKPLTNQDSRRRRPIGLALLVLAGAAILFSISSAPSRLPRFVLGFAYRGPLVDVERWKDFTDRSPDLFGPLGEPARSAIAESPNDSTAVVFTRGPKGMEIEKTHFLLFRSVPVVLAMSPATAEELFLLDQRQGNRFWDAMKFLIQRRKIVVYVFVPRSEIDRVGLTGFLQVIDAIPPEK
jgi:hypothetical protein